GFSGQLRRHSAATSGIAPVSIPPTQSISSALIISNSRSASSEAPSGSSIVFFKSTKKLLERPEVRRNSPRNRDLRAIIDRSFCFLWGRSKLSLLSIDDRQIPMSLRIKPEEAPQNKHSRKVPSLTRRPADGYSLAANAS